MGKNLLHESEPALSATINKATFHDDAQFGDATFHNDARFDEATFDGAAGFDGVSVAPEAIGADHKWPPGWLAEPNGKGGGVLRQEVPPNTETGYKTGPELSA
ncbi:pentapeptide repeat-containing protein [Nonomuraea maheshkhaliensis]|uniref:pentapeptide repeat-containing protein n=1 Tax=Nonomuraea maheshkhaliensis TaxID=419590 RepID=UPI003D15B03E